MMSKLSWNAVGLHDRSVQDSAIRELTARCRSIVGKLLTWDNSVTPPLITESNLCTLFCFCNKAVIHVCMYVARGGGQSESWRPDVCRSIIGKLLTWDNSVTPPLITESNLCTLFCFCNKAVIHVCMYVARGGGTPIYVHYRYVP